MHPVQESPGIDAEGGKEVGVKESSSLALSSLEDPSIPREFEYMTVARILGSMTRVTIINLAVVIKSQANSKRELNLFSLIEFMRKYGRHIRDMLG